MTTCANYQTTTHGFGTIEYTYDANGMNYLTSWKEDANTDGTFELQAEYDYSKQGNPLYKVYRDLNNNAEVTRETYTWNDRDELVGISGRVTEDYVYDYRGLRVKKDSDGNVSKYVYLQNSQPALKINEDENYTDVFVYEGSKRIVRVRIDNMGAMTKEYLVNDYLSNPVVIVDDSGNIEYQTYADPYGNLEMSIGNPSKNIEFQITGKEVDNTGLAYFGARYYDSIAGFVGRDNVKLEDNLKRYFKINSYCYVNNNPMKFRDEDGNDLAIVRNAKLGSGFPSSMPNVLVDDTIRMDLQMALTESYANGIEPEFSEAFRTTEMQSDLYDRLTPLGTDVADPGYSAHEAGFSVDIYMKDNGMTDAQKTQFVDIMGKYGFKRNVKSEDWHFTHENGLDTKTRKDNININQQHYNDNKEMLNKEDGGFFNFFGFFGSGGGGDK